MSEAPALRCPIAKRHALGKRPRPALVLDDGTLLTEGAAIVQYIADLAPEKKLARPNGTIERVKLQAWLNRERDP